MPRKRIEPQEKQTAIEIVAQILQDETCAIKGCTLKFHFGDAITILDQLKKAGYLREMLGN